MPRIIRRRIDNEYWIIGRVALIDVSTRKWPYAIAMIDAEDLTSVIDGGRRWYAYKGKQDRTLYVRRGMADSENKEHLHRLLTEGLDGRINPDHVNGDGLNNRRINLRAATAAQNSFNKIKTTGRGRGISGKITSKYKGVYYCNYKRRWMAVVSINGKRKNVGRFKDEIEAAEAYNKNAAALYGEYARINII